MYILENSILECEFKVGKVDMLFFFVCFFNKLTVKIFVELLEHNDTSMLANTVHREKIRDDYPPSPLSVFHSYRLSVSLSLSLTPVTGRTQRGRLSVLAHKHTVKL